jgi:hypothetical protein
LQDCPFDTLIAGGIYYFGNPEAHKAYDGLGLAEFSRVHQGDTCVPVTIGGLVGVELVFQGVNDRSIGAILQIDEVADLQRRLSLLM